jgi:DNA-binding SARP family transcriptional activator
MISIRRAIGAQRTVRPTGPEPLPGSATPVLQVFGFGGFRAEIDGVELALPPITRTMLARLVLARGGLVDAEELYRDAWPDPAPTVRREQRAAVHKRVAEIRRLLGPRGRSVLLTERAARTSYRLVLDSDQVDLHRFEDLIFRSAATRDTVAADLLAQALAAWTEAPLLGLPDKAFVHDGAARLAGLRDRACRELATVVRGLDRWRDAVAVFDQLRMSQPTDIRLRRLIEQLDREAGVGVGSTVTAPSAVRSVPLHMPDQAPRTALVDRVRERLAAGPVVLTGLLGAGKTQLAIAYAHHRPGRYGLIWWFDASRPELLESQLVALARQVGVSDGLAGLRRFLPTVVDDGVLLIFDGAPDPAQLRPWLPDVGHTLITSRNPGWAETATPVTVGSLARPQSLQLLADRVPGLTVGDAERLAQEFADHPLALAQAAEVMACDGVLVGDYLAELRRHPAGVTGRGQVVSYPTTLAAALRSAVDALADADADAADLLLRCLQTGRDRLPVSALAPSGDPAGTDADRHRQLALIGRSGLARVAAGEVQLHRLFRAVLLDQRRPPAPPRRWSAPTPTPNPAPARCTT